LAKRATEYSRPTFAKPLTLAVTYLSLTMTIWNITDFGFHAKSGFANVQYEIKLWKVNESEFWVIEQGDYLPVLSGTLYSLIRKEFQGVLSELPDQVSMTPARIIDRVKGTENQDYLNLTISNTVTPETIYAEPQDGLRIWAFQGSLFVSDGLKAEMEKIREHTLHFARGFQWWGASPS
jgi:hypothetical protein